MSSTCALSTVSAQQRRYLSPAVPLFSQLKEAEAGFGLKGRGPEIKGELSMVARGPQSLAELAGGTALDGQCGCLAG